MSSLVSVIGTKPEYKLATIANGATESSEINLNGKTVCGLIMPSAFTGTTMTFKGARTVGGTFVTLKDTSGTDKSITVGTSRYIILDPADFAGIENLKLVSGSAEGAARDVYVATRIL